MYQYRQRSSRRRKADYLLPFVIILLLVGIVWAGWALVKRVFLEDKLGSSEPGVQIMIDSGSAKAMTEGQDSWVDVRNGLPLYAGEKVKMGPDGLASLLFSPQMELRLNHSAEVELDQFNKKDEQYEAEVGVNEGMVWASLGNLASSGSNFRVYTDYVSLNSDSAQFVVDAPGTIYMLEGEASVEIQEEGKLIKSVTLKEGQQLVVDEEVIEALKSGSSDEKILFELSEAFQGSAFYRWNAQQEGWSTSDLEEEGDQEGEGEEGEAEEGSDDEEEEETNPSDQEETLGGTVEITSPSKEATYESDTMTFNVEAKVPAGTTKVVVNTHTLTQYKAGDTVARYYAREANNNVKVGDNVYKVTAYDKNDKKLGEDSLTVKVKASASTPETPETPSSSGDVSITAPSSNATYESATMDFDVKASVPASTAKVVVNGYTLSQYQAGGTSATYRVRKVNGNVKEGENTYTVTAYDKDGAKLGSDALTVTIKADATSGATPEPPASTVGTSDAPSFIYPVTTGTYSTSLSPLTVGGAIGSKYRWLYVNDQALDSHALGQTSWSTTIQLKPGLNEIKIYAEDEEKNTTGVKAITIDYQGT